MKILLVILLCISNLSFCQVCEKVYEEPEVAAQYRNGSEDLMKFANEHVLPVMARSVDKYGSRPTKMIASLLIDKEGNVKGVDFVKFDVSAENQEVIRKEMLNMDQWTPGKNGGQKVCSKAMFVIACAKWG